MPEVWFIGDTHFGHAKILTFTPKMRLFNTIEEHDETIVVNWNKVVSEKDLVYHLGDVSFGNFDILKELKGIKKLILGNHDAKRFNNLLPYFTSFDGAVEWHGLILTHIPVHESQIQYRWRANVHGHVHGNTLPDKRYINVSCEAIDCTPIHFEIIKARVEELHSNE